MDSLLTNGITYGALDRALHILGFQEETYETHRLYKTEEQGAIIVLPRDMEMGEEVRAVHLLTARHTVTGMGIADEAEFEELLTHPSESKPLLTVGSNGYAPVRGGTRKSRVSTASPIEAH